MPGTAVINTETRTYYVNIVADLVEYFLNEDFEIYEEGVAGTSQTQYPFTSPEYNREGGELPITVEKGEDGGKNLFFPLDPAGGRVRQLNAYATSPILLGSGADDFKIVYEIDVKLDNASSANTFLGLYDYEGDSVVRLEMYSAKLTYVDSSGKYDFYNFSDKLDKFVRLKFVLDKKNRRVDVYVNDEIKLKNQGLHKPTADNLRRFTVQAGYNSRANMWIDNYKVYNSNIAMEAYEQENPEVSVPDTEAEFVPIDIDFNSYELFSNINNFDGWYTPAANGEGTKNPITVERRLYKMGLDDRVMYLPPADPNEAVARFARFNLPVSVGIGTDAVDSKKLVFEFEMLTRASAGLGVALTDAADKDILAFLTTNASFRFRNNITEDVRFYDEGEDMPGHNMFNKIRAVIDKAECTVTLYKDGQILAKDLPLSNNLKSGSIATMKFYGSATATAPLHIDNVRVYQTD